MQTILIRQVSRQELRRGIEIIDVLIAMVLVVLAIISLIYYAPLKNQISTQVETYGLIGLFLISGFMEFIPQIFNPIFPMIVLIAAGFNVHFTIIVTALGSMAGSFFGFEVGRKYGSAFISSIFDDEAMFKIENFMKKYGNLCVTIAALTPVPYVPIVFGALGQVRKDFFVWGIIPRILSFIFLGYAIHLGFVSMNL